MYVIIYGVIYIYKYLAVSNMKVQYFYIYFQYTIEKKNWITPW
jgi:hypothetical protein